MRGTEMAQGLLAEFGRTIGLSGLGLDESGACCLLIGDSLYLGIYCEDTTARLLLTARLASPPPEGREALYRTMLATNASAGGHMILGLDEASGDLVQLGWVGLEGLETAHFGRLVEGFVAEADRWREEIVQAGTTAAESAPAPGIRV